MTNSGQLVRRKGCVLKLGSNDYFENIGDIIVVHLSLENALTCPTPMLSGFSYKDGTYLAVYLFD